MSARNTYPFIPRIRAHCMVEMTLDRSGRHIRLEQLILIYGDCVFRCVQKLRRRVALENVALHDESEKASGKVGLNRVPSFYTSRSIVNLSGLSVSDPLPVVLSSSGEGCVRELEQEDEQNRIILSALADDRKKGDIGGTARRSALNRLHHPESSVKALIEGRYSRIPI